MAKLSSTEVHGDLTVDGTIRGTVNGSITGNAATATALQNARTINGTSFNGTANITTANWGTARTLTIGSTGKSVNGSGNVSWTLAEIGAAASAHNHTQLYGASGSSWTTATRNIQTDLLFEFSSHISKSATGLFPNGDNSNAMITINRHSGPYDSQLGFSSNGNLYYRSVDGTAMTDSTAWKQLAFTSSNITGSAATLTTARSINGTNFNGSANITTANWGTARDITIGSTKKSVNGSANVSWTLDEIGAAAKSHGTHLTIGTGASNAAAGNHTHSGYAASDHTHTSIKYQDTRAVNTTPDGMPEGLSVHLKSNGTDGLNDGGSFSYHSTLMMKGWGDNSGGTWGQLAITGNNNLWFRASSSGTAWQSWKRVSQYGHTHTYLPLSGGTLTNHLTMTDGARIYLSDNADRAEARIGVDSSTNDVYISNTANNWLRLKADKTMAYAGYKVYTAYDKPTPADIGTVKAQKLTQSSYNSATKDSNTLYIIVG